MATLTGSTEEGHEGVSFFSQVTRTPEVTAEQSRAEASTKRQNEEASKAPAFETTTNSETLEEYVDQSNSPKEVENLTASEREKFLRDGTLPPSKADRKEKPREAAEEKTTETTEQAQGGDDFDRDIQEWDLESREHKNWKTPEHAKSFQSVTQRIENDLRAQGDHAALNEASMKIRVPTDMLGFMQHSLAETKNPTHAFRVMVTQPGVLDQMRKDWEASAGNPIRRLVIQMAIHKAVSHIGGQSAGTGKAGMERRAKLVSDALPPPREVGGHANASTDEEAAALKRGDVSAYMEAANRRESAKWQASRGRGRRR
jgi:hypothetical protein